MKQPLPCIDFPRDGDPTGSRATARCKEQYLATSSGRYKCPNLEKGERSCKEGMFLYPRRWSKGNKYFHFHQGIDLSVPGYNPRDPPNVFSVADGRVVRVQHWDRVSDGYGTNVCIYNDELGYTFLYAHLESVDKSVVEGAWVCEHAVIGKVGNTGNAGKPHLHFEVLKRNGAPRGGIAEERVLGEPRAQELRQDPLAVLEALGPWSARQLYYPFGENVDSDSETRLNKVVEGQDGGFFPLGVNNFWHGGVHLPANAGSIVRAPFDGKIVAVRLGATTAASEAAYGNLNFILLRHEIPENIWDQMQGRKAEAEGSGSASRDPLKMRRIGPVASAENHPDDVLRVKQRLHELGHYKPPKPSSLTNGKFDSALRKAIRAYQSTFDAPPGKQHWPSGVIDVEDDTWSRLFPGDVADAEPEASSTDSTPSESSNGESKAPTKDDPARKRTVYVLLMHLGAWALEDAVRHKIRAQSKDKSSEGYDFIRWPTRLAARFAAPSPAKKEAEEDDDGGDDAEADDEAADRAEAASHTLTADVGLNQGSEADIRWVEARLIRFGMLSSRNEPTGRADAELAAAIERFQEEVAWPGKPKYWDGIVQKGGKTHRALMETRASREKAASSSSSRRGSREDVPEQQLAAEIAKTNARGHARVVADLDIAVQAGEPLWRSGSTKTPLDDGKIQTVGELHFEIFSEERLFPDWGTIDDPDDDLLVDAPATVIDHLDASGDERIPFEEISGFYRTPAAVVLRWTVCRFRSEWDPDLSRIMARLDELQLDTTDVEENLRPYAWWKEAHGRLFDGVDSHVWHYNPIQFLSAYQELLGEGAQATADAAKKGTLQVIVKAENGRPPADPMTVKLVQDRTETSKKLGKSGEVSFEGLEPGHYELHLDGMDEDWVPVTVITGDRSTVTVDVARPGQPPPTVDLEVSVRTSGGTYAKNARVTLRGGALDGPQSKAGGKVQFDPIPEGSYDLEVEYDGGSDDPNDLVRWSDTIEVSVAKPRVFVKLPPPVCDLTIDRKDGAAYVPGTLTPRTEGGVPIPFLTGPEGEAEMRVSRGKYQLIMDGKKKDVFISRSRQTVFV